jgi:hypothetical protein
MKKNHLSILSILFLCLLFSCNKDKPAAPSITPPVSPGTPTDSTLSVNLTYPNTDPVTSLGTSFELIISEASGTILLDTVALFNTPISAILKTRQSSVDLTTVVHNLRTGIYGMTVYKTVQPANWVYTSTDFSGTALPPSSPGEVYYKNVPPAAGLLNYEFSTYYTLGSSATIYPNGDIDEKYTYYPGDVTYLLLPTLGLYKFQPAAGIDDTLDLSQMDTTVNVHFTKPSLYTTISATLDGIMDTTNISKFLFLYDFSSPNPLADLEYPAKKFVQKYSLSVSGSNSNNESVSYSNYSDTVATVLPFPLPSSYNLSSTQNNNFTVSFNSPSPLYYETEWTTGTIELITFAPSDSTVLQPLNLLTSLKSRLLQGQATGSLTLAGFGFGSAEGATYQTYFSTQFTPTQASTKPWVTTTNYWKNF